MGIGKNIARATANFLTSLVEGDEPEYLGKAVTPSSAVRPVQTLPEQPEIEDKKTARPLWDGGFGPIFTDWSGKIERQQVGKPAITPITLYTLAHTDPVTFSILDVYKTRITEMGWTITPDIDKEKSELLLWEKEAGLGASKYAVEPKPLFESHFLPPTIANPLRAQLKKLDGTDPDSKKKIRWLIDWADLQLRKELIPLAHKAETALQGCNGDAVDPFTALMEMTIDDMCIYDAPSIGGVYSVIGDLQQLYHLPGHEIKIYKNPDFSTPQPPYRAYGWEVNGRIIEEFTTDDLLYFPRNPQQNGYGFSPLEAASYIITASLYADAYNLDSFKSNIPPGILDVGKITPEQRQRFRVWWNNEIEGKDGGKHKVMMTNFGKDAISYMEMKGKSQTDMQFMEYLEWTLLIKCMCYGVSPQEIGFTKFFKYETSTNQVKMTNRGVEDAAKFIESAFTEGILKRMLGLKGLKFQLKRSNTMINKEATDTATARINAGLASQNEIREEWGQRPLAEGGDIPAITTRYGIVPVAEIGAELESADEDPEDPAPGEEADPDDLEAAVKAAAAGGGKGASAGPNGPTPEGGIGGPKAMAKRVGDAIHAKLMKKLNIDYKAPAGGGQSHATRIRGARSRRNGALRTFKKSIGSKAAQLAKEHGGKIKKFLGDA